MNHSHTLSVVIPTTGRNLDQLKECLTSVFEARQTERLQEIIIAGNGLPTESAARVRELMTTIPVPESLRSKFRLHCFPDKEESIAKSWNRAFQLAHADYVHFLHDDDRIAPSFYARNMEVIERDGPDLLFCGAEQFGGLSSLILWPGRILGDSGFLTKEEVRKHITELYRYIIPCPTAVYRSCAWKHVGGWNELYGYACDQAYFLFALLGNHKIYAIQEVMYYYRIHEQSVSTEWNLGCNIMLEMMWVQAYGYLYQETRNRSLLDEAKDCVVSHYYDQKLKGKRKGWKKPFVRMLGSIVKRSVFLRRILAELNSPLRAFLDWYYQAVAASDMSLLHMDFRELPAVSFHQYVDTWHTQERYVQHCG